MSWVALALLAPAIYCCVNFIDKYVVEHKVKDPKGMPIYGAIAAIVFGTSVWLLAGLPVLSARNAVLVVASGVVSMWGFALYFLALAKSQTSYIIALVQTSPLFVLVLSSIFLDERLSALQIAGFFLVFSGILGLSIDKIEKRIKLNEPFYFMLMAMFLVAIGSVLIKYTIDLNGFASILAYESWGISIGGATLFMAFPQVRRSFFKSFKNVGKRVLAIMFFNEALFIVSKAVTFLAISLGPVALVSVLGGTQVFYGILYGAILTLLFPKLFNEDITRGSVVRNVAFSAILFLGVWFIGYA